MAVTDISVLDAPVKEIFLRKKILGPGGDFVELLLRDGTVIDEPFGLLKIFQHIDGNRLCCAVSVYLVGPIRLLIKRCQLVNNGINMNTVKLSRLNQVAHHFFFGHSGHLYRIFHEFTSPVQGVAVALLGDRDKIKVDIWTEATVEQEFLFAAMLSFFQGGKIKKTEINRFFKFVDKFACKKNKGNMGLHQLDVSAGQAS